MKRRRFSSEFKLQCVLDMVSGRRSPAQICRNCWENTLSSYVSVIRLFAGPVIGATIGFNRTRRYNSPAESETALVNFQNGQMSLGVPRIHFRVDTFGRRALSQNIDLLRVRF